MKVTISVHFLTIDRKTFVWGDVKLICTNVGFTVMGLIWKLFSSDFNFAKQKTLLHIFTVSYHIFSTIGKILFLNLSNIIKCSKL